MTLLSRLLLGIVVCLPVRLVQPAFAAPDWLDQLPEKAREIRKAYVSGRQSLGDKLLGEYWEKTWDLPPITFTNYRNPRRTVDLSEEPPKNGHPDMGRILWAESAPTPEVSLSRFWTLYEDSYDKRSGEHLLGDSIDARAHVAVELNILRLSYMTGKTAQGDIFLVHMFGDHHTGE